MSAAPGDCTVLPRNSADAKRMRRSRAGVIPLPGVLSYLAHSDMLCTSFHFTARGESEDYPLSYSNCSFATGPEFVIFDRSPPSHNPSNGAERNACNPIQANVIVRPAAFQPVGFRSAAAHGVELCSAYVFRNLGSSCSEENLELGKVIEQIWFAIWHQKKMCSVMRAVPGTYYVH